MKANEIREYLENIPFDELKFGPYENHQRLGKKFHLRFEMSGFDEKKITSIEINNNILLLFAKFGIYKNCDYLFISFHKGTPYIHFKKINELEHNLIDSLSGYTTCEIIEQIFILTSK